MGVANHNPRTSSLPVWESGHRSRRMTVIIQRDVILPIHFSAHGRDQTGQNVKLEQNTNGRQSEIILILFK